MNIDYLNSVKEKFKYNNQNLYFIAGEGAVRTGKKKRKDFMTSNFKMVKMCKYVLQWHFISEAGCNTGL